MALTKLQILNEIKRTAAANGGEALGWRKFATETGITNADWLGKIWARWSDALREAGFAPKAMTQAHGEVALLAKYAALALRLGRLPTVSDARLAISNGLEFPDWNTFTRQFGGKQQFIAKLREYCSTRIEYAAVVDLCDNYVPRPRIGLDETTPLQSTIGYVYLIKHGSRREYKIGRTNNVLRRQGEINIELPEKVHPVHVITTDDAAGIEAYWHNRFAAKRKNGEWFELTAADVAAFKRMRC